jgi:hypothetical protein
MPAVPAPSDVRQVGRATDPAPQPPSFVLN